MLAQLCTLDAPTRARVKAMGKGDRERYARSIKHQTCLPRGDWPAFWEVSKESADHWCANKPERRRSR